MANRQLPSSFEQFDHSGWGSNFYQDPRIGPRYIYSYEFGAHGYDENSVSPAGYDPNIHYKDVFETNVRICGKLTAAPEFFPTFSVEVDGIYNMLTYLQRNEKPQGNTTFSCGLTLPIEYFAPHPEESEEIVRIMARILFDCATELGHNEQGPLLEAPHEAAYKLEEPFAITVKALSAFRTKAPVLDVLSRITDSYLLRLEDALTSSR